MANIRFESPLRTIGTWMILHVPPEASAQLSSRGQVMVEGTLNSVPFQTPLEPDGKGSHWFRVGQSLLRAAGAAAGDTVRVVMEQTAVWPEPEVPADWAATLDANPAVQEKWLRITPMARHEWLRWIGSTKEPETRKRRIDVSCSKLLAGERRPCCFNRNMCCVPDVSKNGVLLDPAAPSN